MAETVFAAPPVGARSAQRRQRLLSLAATAALSLGSVVAMPAVAQAAETPSFTTQVTEVPDERIDIAIEGTGYGDVQALPGQSEPHAYFTLIEKGADLSDVTETQSAISATIDAEGNVSDILPIPAAELDASTEYEVISWPSRSFPTDANLYARTDITIDWGVLFPGEVTPQPAVPSFTAGVTEIPDERIDIAIEGTGYGDVQALPGQSEPHAYFTLIEKGADLSDVTETQSAISATIDADGNVSDIFPIPAAELDASIEYEVISWPSRSFPTEANLYARADITIDWTALFPVEEPTWDPQLTVSPATELNAEGDTVTVTAAGYNPAQGLYVFLCEDVELPADLWQLALGCRDGAALVTPTEDGTFELEFTVQQLNDGPTSVYTAANHTAQADRTQDAKAPLAFAEPVEPQPAVPTFTAEVTEIPDERIDIAIEGSGYDDVQALPGQAEPHAYFTLIEKGADLSDVTETQSAISATIDAEGNVSDVLPIPATELDAATEYEVISWPSRSFPSEENLYTRADITIDWAVLFPEAPQPEEPVLTLTGPAGEELTSVTQGDDVTFSLSPVEAGTEFEVTIESDPITLPDRAVADAEGIASATWTVADDFEPGEHTVTFASGSASYSAVFEVLAANGGPGGPGDGDDDSGNSNDGAGGGNGTAPDTNGSASGQLAVTGADGAGIAFSAAALLMLVGAGALVLTRRRALTTTQV
ncbi:MAG: hypothetical protein ACTH8F_08075 [Microbacterium sp.]|uniref:hypothetical protein n=1 Tax=Microbacterium sp. TaxID=51671 RepID=UPI003F9E24D2